MKTLRFYFVLALLPVPGYSTPIPLDLGAWVKEDYVSVDGPSNWAISGPNNSVAEQTLNSDPSILRSGGIIDIAAQQIEGTWRVNDLTDNDFMGFIFGYQNRGAMYLFDWGNTTQSGLHPGMTLKIIDTGDPLVDPPYDDFFAQIDTAIVDVLHSNTIPWSPLVDYGFRLNFGSNLFEIEITQGVNVLEHWIVGDSTFTGGDFGFYNASQSNVLYSGFTIEQDPPPIGVAEPPTIFLLTFSIAGILFSWGKNRVIRHQAPPRAC